MNALNQDDHSSEPAAGKKKFPVSWDMFHRDSRALAWKENEHAKIIGIPPKMIVCVTRGGMFAAAIMARELNIRLIENICVVSYDYDIPAKDMSILKPISQEFHDKIDHFDGKGVLVVDDLTDTGRTFAAIRHILSSKYIRYVSVYAKPAGLPMVDEFITEVSQDTWIFQPWDTKMDFADPIVPETK